MSGVTCLSESSPLRIAEQEMEAYWRTRDKLLEAYKGRWVVVARGEVVAVGDSAEEAAKLAYSKVGYRPVYANKVGEEEKVMRRIYRNAPANLEL